MTNLARKAADKLPAFNPTVHPELIFRAALMGLPKQIVADLIGIPPDMLDQWVEEEPQLQQAFAKAQQADAQVVATVYYEAIGWNQYENKPSEKGPSMRAASMWLKHRQNWNDKAPPPTQTVDKVTSERLLERVEELESKSRTVRALPPPPVVDVRSRVHTEDDDEF